MLLILDDMPIENVKESLQLITIGYIYTVLLAFIIDQHFATTRYVYLESSVVALYCAAYFAVPAFSLYYATCVHQDRALINENVKIIKKLYIVTPFFLTLVIHISSLFLPISDYKNLCWKRFMEILCLCCLYAVYCSPDYLHIVYIMFSGWMLSSVFVF